MKVVDCVNYFHRDVDASVMAIAIVVLGAAACIAGLIPARCAASIDPVQALRVE
jgi:macrolide transport system ATP-binding/permease protein